MIFPSFERLANYYQARMLRLFTGMLDYPDLVADPAFHREALKLARSMAREVSSVNARSWREAAHKSLRGRQIYTALRSEIERGGLAPVLEQIAGRNAELISSLQVEIGRRVTLEAARLQQAGLRAAEVERQVRRLAPELAKPRIRLIARTEISRAETEVTRARSERIGIEWYQWATSKDQRVRPSHRNLDGVLVAWSDPPQPEELIREHSNLGHNHAGCFPNCRCVSLPLADMDEVKWPARVYRAGRIQRMTRAEFTRVAGVRIAA